MIDGRAVTATLAIAALLAAGAAEAQQRSRRDARRDITQLEQRSSARGSAAGPSLDDPDLVNLDVKDAELSAVIEMIAKMTGKNFIFDDSVRGRVTIISPTKIPTDQAYAVFESVLQVKGFTTVTTPSGAIKVIPVRDAKESSVETRESYGPPANRDAYVTRLIPLRFIDSESIVATLKPLVSKEAAMAAYPPTNTVILTESASNIRRIFSILESIDVETYKDELAVIKVEYADATTLGDQISEIYGAEVAATSAAARRTRTSRRTTTPTAGAAAHARVRILTDARTNSLIVLAARTQLGEIRELVKKLDVPVTGGGRIHVRYLNYANAEELAQTLSALISGQPALPAGGAVAGGQAQQLRAAVTELAEGIAVTADPATNSLVIQASQEGFATLETVIAKLDVERPQVLVEGLIMEVDVTGREELGFGAIYRLISGDTDLTVGSLSGVSLRETTTNDDADFEDEVASTAAGLTAGPLGASAAPFVMNFLRDKLNLEEGKGSLIQSIITAAAADGDANIISAPHILTSDNEQAEIRIGDNIPIITSRVSQPGTAGATTGFNTSVNVERQDVGVTLRVTPQITEGDSLRLEIFQEITDVTESEAGDVEEVGVTLKNRRIENTVMVRDHETVVIGGLISDDYTDVVTKVPFLGDIPILGWLFKSTAEIVNKKNLLVFLTPHIVRSAADLERETIRKREEFSRETGDSLRLTEAIRAEEEEQRRRAEAEGVPYEPKRGANPVRTALLRHEARYPLERMREIEREEREERERAAAEAQAAEHPPLYFVQAAIYGDEAAAMQTLTELVDAGYDGSLISGESDGVVLFEIRLGPYPTLEEAQRAGGSLRRAHGLAPAVIIGTPEEP